MLSRLLSPILIRRERPKVRRRAGEDVVRVEDSLEGVFGLFVEGIDGEGFEGGRGREWVELRFQLNKRRDWVSP